MYTEINNLVNNDKVLNTFLNLKYRWEDESKYENFNEYGKTMFNVVQETLNGKASFVKALKRPFGLVFEFNGTKFKLFLKSNSRYSWLACAIIK